MRLGRSRGTEHGKLAVVVSAGDGPWVDVRRAAQARYRNEGASAGRARELATVLIPESMSSCLASGTAFWEAARAAADEASPAAVVDRPDFAACLDPVAFKDFMVFERHFSFGYEWRGLPVPDVLYEFPVAYQGNHLAFHGPGDEIEWPTYSEQVDFELELGIVVGKKGRNLTPDESLSHVAGLTLLNDFSARDIQRREMAAGLGPAKGKHFASGIGPWFVELSDLPSDGFVMRASVNGEQWAEAHTSEAIWSIAEIVAWASAGEDLYPGTILGTGTLNGGSGIELNRTLAVGAEIELSADALGSLRNKTRAADGGWMPRSRQRTKRS